MFGLFVSIGDGLRFAITKPLFSFRPARSPGGMERRPGRSWTSASLGARSTRRSTRAGNGPWPSPGGRDYGLEEVGAHPRGGGRCRAGVSVGHRGGGTRLREPGTELDGVGLDELHARLEA